MEKALPKLRFPEFDGNWMKSKIGKITNVTAGGTPNSSKNEYWNGNIPWMNSGELNKKTVSSTDNFITDLGLKKSSTKLIPKNCVLIGLAGQGKTRGTAAINTIELCTNQSVASIFPNEEKFIPKFLFYNIDNRYEELRKLSTGEGGRGGLNLQIIKGLLFNYPSLQEQQKIATLLTSVDERLTLLAQQKEKLELYKKGVMQQIFSQKLRFKDENRNSYPDWEEKKLGEIAKITIGEFIIKTKQNPNSPYPVFNGGKSYTGFYDDYNNEGNKIIISARGANAGFVNFYKEKYWAGNSCYSVSFKAIDNYFIEYFFYYVKFFENRFTDFQQAANIPSVSKKDVENFKTDVPCLEEQQKIASFLSAIDVQIEGVNKKIAQTKTFKKGLLQQLFV